MDNFITIMWLFWFLEPINCYMIKGTYQNSMSSSHDSDDFVNVTQEIKAEIHQVKEWMQKNIPHFNKKEVQQIANTLENILKADAEAHRKKPTDTREEKNILQELSQMLNKSIIFEETDKNEELNIKKKELNESKMQFQPNMTAYKIVSNKIEELSISDDKVSHSKEENKTCDKTNADDVDDEIKNMMRLFASSELLLDGDD